MGIINIAHAGVISDAPSLSQVGFNVLSFLLSSLAVIAIIMAVVYGGMYLTAYGDERQIEKAKKAFYYAIIGIIVALSFLGLAHTVGQFFQ